MSTWYEDRENLEFTARYMADNGRTIDDIVHMLGKPWHYTETFELAEETYNKHRNDAELAAAL
jgi:hypothetical protein